MLCVAASGTYFVNDVTDIAADRLHPTKRLRPVAAGLLPAPLTLILGIGLLAGALGLSTVLGLAFAGVVLACIALTVAYSMWLKMVPVVDVAAVASCYLLRVSPARSPCPLSSAPRFCCVASFGALFIVVGKRHGDHLALDQDERPYRSTLTAYTPDFTSQLVTASLTATLLSYAEWAFTLDVGERWHPVGRLLGAAVHRGDAPSHAARRSRRGSRSRAPPRGPRARGRGGRGRVPARRRAVPVVSAR